jgi:hypothetical protein
MKVAQRVHGLEPGIEHDPHTNVYHVFRDNKLVAVNLGKPGYVPHGGPAPDGRGIKSLVLKDFLLLQVLPLLTFGQ